jgi:uncharacterized Zn finger protein
VSASIRRKALNYLRGERVRIISAVTPVHALRPHGVAAYVDGHNGRYTVRFEAGAWSCTCPDGVACAHVAAVQLVTGWQGPASKGGA